MRENIFNEPSVDYTYSFLKDYIIEHTYSPTQREIAQAFCMSPSTVRHALRVLEDHGYITRVRKKPRTIRLKNLKVVEKL